MAGGRPTDYKDEYCNDVYKLCLLGATDKEIADFFEVDERTINNWKVAHPEFFQSIKKGKVKADAEVAERLYKRAVGYSFKEITYEKVVVDKPAEPEDEETEGENIEVDLWKKRVVHKDLAPDPVSMIYWLKNRRGRVNEAEGAQKWADKHEHVHDGTIPVKLVFESDTKNEPLKDDGGNKEG